MKKPTPLTSQLKGEAAAWLILLHSGDRDARVEHSFQRWVESDDSHKREFQQVTRVWEELGGAAEVHRSMQRERRSWSLAAAGSAMFVAASVAAIVVLTFGQTSEFAATHGQQRHVVLGDGSALTLDTDSKVSVKYSLMSRRVQVENGQVLFDVAHDPRRPFIAVADGRQVRAIGTSFEVFRTPNDVSVTLLKGKVSVGKSLPLVPLAEPGAVVLQAGQRWTRSHDKVVQLDAATVEMETAWLRKELLLSDTPLNEAIAEMNRYAVTPIILEDTKFAHLPVSGVFAIGSTDSFVAAVSSIYGLKVIRSAKSIRLVGS